MNAHTTTKDPLVLTQREIEVLHELALGLSNQEIGQALGIDERTARTHVGSILSKLGVRSRTAALVFAMRRGLVPIPTPNTQEGLALRTRLAELYHRCDLLSLRAQQLHDELNNLDENINSVMTALYISETS